jgi:hypothetical protein
VTSKPFAGVELSNNPYRIKNFIFLNQNFYIFLPSLPLLPAAAVQVTPVLAILLTTIANGSSIHPESAPREAVII